MEAATLSAVRKAKEKLENGKETHWKDGNCNFFVWPLNPSKIAFRHAICLSAKTGEVSTGGLFAFLMAYWRPFAYAICLKTPTWHRNINKTINIHNIRMYICIYLCGSQTYIQVEIYIYICMDKYICLYLYMYVKLCICMCICRFIHLFICLVLCV